MAQMKATTINDFFAKDGKIREDGRMVHDVCLLEVKKPVKSKGEWDPLQVTRHHARRRSALSARPWRLPLIKTH